MPKPTGNPRNEPKPVRVPPNRAAGLDAEYTAQPRPPSDELGSADGGDGGLSVDPEDLGARFLSEAVEQGEASPHAALDRELSILNGPPTDEVMTSPNFEYENTLWEQTVELTLQTQGAADQLRGSPLVDDLSEIDGALPKDEIPPIESSMREQLLLDRASDEEGDDETVEPEEQAAGERRQTPFIPPVVLPNDVGSKPELRANPVPTRPQPTADSGRRASPNEPRWWIGAAARVIYRRVLAQVTTAARFVRARVSRRANVPR